MKRQLTVLAAAMLAPVGAMAAEGTTSELSYNYLELDYVNLDIDTVGDNGNIVDDFDNGDGWGARGSLALGDSFFVFANYAASEADATFINDADQLIPADADIRKVDLGLGFHMPMGDDTDLVISGAYTDTDRDRFSFGASEEDDSLDDLNDDSSDGYFADAAIRTQLASWVEASLGARYFDIEEVDGVSVIGNLLFEFTPSFGLNIGVDAGDELSTWVAGVRLTF